MRRGLAEVLAGRRIRTVQVHNHRAVRRQIGGSAQFTSTVTGARVTEVRRRGKYLWWVLDDGAAVVAHLGMSGQFRTAGLAEDPGFGPHERVRFILDDDRVLCFVDQRTFGWLLADEVADSVPSAMAHIARDPFDPEFDIAGTADRLRSRRTGIKRALLDQTVVSGIGNIYADETLWRVRMHPARATDSLTGRQARAVLTAAADVMAAALAAGGTSFDPLYVNVNGESGWFARDLMAYGRQGEPCRRCGRPLIREAFTNRSSYRCPQCQRTPVARHRATASRRSGVSEP